MKEKIKTIIVDDENLARDILKNYLLKYPEIEIVAQCSNGFEAIKAITEHKPDLLFLDIQMPKINGFELLELLEDPPVIIFTTAYDQYALKAFEVNAVDYLLKPLSPERLSEAISRAKNRIESKGGRKEKINELLRNVEDKDEIIERVIVKHGSKVMIIPVEKIVYLEAEDDYVMIHSEEGKYLKQKTMKYFEEHLDKNEFLRIHRSYIVRLGVIKQIELFEKESYKVILASGIKLPVSKAGYAKLKEVFN